MKGGIPRQYDGSASIQKITVSGCHGAVSMDGNETSISRSGREGRFDATWKDTARGVSLRESAGNGGRRIQFRPDHEYMFRNSIMT